ncbi:hypothetical protein JJQ59_28520 [Cupriavidus necator]|uniref:Uncharacterized protein n=1 Tax=Cupriavidus necator TaxID=106590 RepID=A0A367PH87_CUPNE|nr:hypothetical protein [Cupriavidus necator]QQX86706.1 hypothetical protein JJQ59_28520 [Cupriavidus necator]RCJ07220.1 hypothetical protein DDK22_17575 [Cupriavidus necator]
MHSSLSIEDFIAQMQNRPRRPEVPGAAIRYGKDFASSRTFHDYPDLPILELDAYDVPDNFDPHCVDVSFGSGALVTVAGIIGTLRFQIADYQATILVNPADACIQKCLKSWRDARNVGIAWNVEGNAVAMLLEVNAHFAKQFDSAATTASMKAADFVQLAFGYVRTGFLAANATSDLDTYPVLRRSMTHVAMTKFVDTEANALMAQIESLTHLARRDAMAARHAAAAAV